MTHSEPHTERHTDPESDPTVKSQYPTTPTPTPTPNSMQATSTVDVLAAAINELGLRGIANPGQFAHLGAEAILGTVRWFDAQNGRVGEGVLVNELRVGGKPGWQPRASSVDREREYGNQIRDWLNENFPDLEEPSGNPHPAAIAAVIRLHYVEGKGQLTRAKHGPMIRAAVRAWAERWGSA